jgi:hypothetical protein|tara:strand:- start:1166 stop:2386 length:1221 start_codon:yes stop_codon:yes gene_type:complete
MGFFDKIADVAKEVGRPARNIAIGYLTEKIENTRAADARNAKYIELATEQYFNEDRPNFIKQEEERYNNFLKIKRDKGLPFAQFADSEAGGFATTNAQQTEIFLKRVAELKPDQIEAIETSFNERRKKRAESFDEKNAFVRKQFQTMPGGPGDMNVMSVFFPNEGEDIAEVGVKQTSKMDTEMQPTADQPTVDQTGGLLDIVDETYDINNPKHLQLEKIAAQAFERQFFNKIQNKYNFSIPADKNPDGSFKDSRYVTLQFIKQGYDDAVNRGYNLGFQNYARDKFVQGVLDRRGVKGFTGTLPVDTTQTQPADVGAMPGDGKKFDTPTVSKVDVKEDPKITTEIPSGASGSPATVINDLREIIAKINDSQTLSEEEKIKRVEQARGRAIERLKEMGAFNESILRQI